MYCKDLLEIYRMRQKQNTDQTLPLSKDLFKTTTGHSIMGFELRMDIKV